MIPIRIQTLIVASAPGPSILVLCPVEDVDPHKTCRIVPVWMGTAEATQLGMAMEHGRFERPMTHDLFLDALTNLDACVDHVLITRVEGQTFYARLALRQHGRLIDLDARPSDAIALAVREDAPLYISEEALQKGSFPYVFKGPVDDEGEIERFHSFVQNIDPEDFNIPPLDEDGENPPEE